MTLPILGSLNGLSDLWPAARSLHPDAANDHRLMARQDLAAGPGRVNEIEGGMRVIAQKIVAKVLQSYWRLSRALTLGAQGCVIAPDGRILLIRHTYRPGWHFPGGGVEKGETVLSALTRELSEEAGVVLTAEPRLFGLYSNARAFPNDHIALYVVTAFAQPVPPKPNHEIAEHGFFAPDALPADIVAPTRARIAEITAGAPPSAIW